MDNYRLKMKVGEHEFDADGPPESVERQFQAWKELIATVPRQIDDKPADSGEQQNSAGTPDVPISMDKIFRAEGRVVSLTAPPELAPEAALLVLLGQRHYRGNESVTGSEVMDGLAQSGFRLARVDRVMDSLASEGAVIRSGQHRGTRYRLSNIGLTRAQNIARDRIARVA